MVETDGLLNNSTETELVTKQRSNRRLSEKKDASTTDLKKSDVINFKYLINFNVINWNLY